MTFFHSIRPYAYGTHSHVATWEALWMPGRFVSSLGQGIGMAWDRWMSGKGQVRPLKDRVWNIGVSAFLESRIQVFFFLVFQGLILVWKDQTFVG